MIELRGLAIFHFMNQFKIVAQIANNAEDLLK